jgi:hypothetical protein
LTPEEARRLTDEVKAEATDLAERVRNLKRRQAHSALGYETWQEYVRDEFGFEARYADRLVSFADVRDALRPRGLDSENLTEYVARPLASLLPEDREGAREDEARMVEAREKVADAWQAVSKRHAAEVAAKAVERGEAPPAKPPPLTAATVRRLLVAENYLDQSSDSGGPRNRKIRLGECGDRLIAAAKRLDKFATHELEGRNLTDDMARMAKRYAKRANAISDVFLALAEHRDIPEEALTEIRKEVMQ